MLAVLSSGFLVIIAFSGLFMLMVGSGGRARKRRELLRMDLNDDIVDIHLDQRPMFSRKSRDVDRGQRRVEQVGLLNPRQELLHAFEDYED